MRCSRGWKVLSKTRDNIFDWFSDEKNRRDLRTGIVISFVIIAIFVYQGFRYGLTLDLLFRLETLYDSVFILFILSLVVNDLSERAEFDELLENNGLKELNERLTEKADSITDFVTFAKQIKIEEKQRYKIESEAERERIIRVLEINLANYIDKNKQKQIKKIQNKINMLNRKNEQGEYIKHIPPKDFERYGIDDFLSDGSHSKKKKSSIPINYRSKKTIKRRNLTITVLRTFGLVFLRAGLTSQTGSLLDIIIFASLVIPIAFLGGLMVYENTRYDMRGNEKASKKKKLKLFEQILNIEV